MYIRLSLLILSMTLLFNINCSSQANNQSGTNLYVDEQLDFQFTDQDDWLSMYIAGNKIGYAVFSLDTLEDLSLREREFMIMQLTAGSRLMEINTKGVSYGSKDGYVDSFFYRIVSADQTLSIKGLYMNDSIYLNLYSNNSEEEEVYAVDRLPLTLVDAVRFFGDEDQVSIEIFEPSTQQVVEILIEDMGIDTNPEYGLLKHYRATMLGIPIEIWLDENDKLVKQEMTALQMELVSHPRIIAEDMSQAEISPDIYRQFKVDIDRQIENPRNLKYLKALINGLEIDISCSNQIQQDNIVEIFSQEIEDINFTIPDSVSKYIQSSSMIQSDNSDIISTAEEITKDAVTPLEKVILLNDWVFDNIDKEPTFTVPSALDVLNSLKGDCNEHSTLLTALLRASGIPARITVGIVYANDDGFYYHAWCEVYLGKWFSIDPTMGQIPADATHIAISRGSSAEQAKIMTVMGKIDINILSTSY